MARLRKGCSYRKTERPYTRYSRFRKKSFVRAMPHMLLNKFNMGNAKKKFGYQVDLVAKNPVQIRHNALESARMTANRALEKPLGKAGYRLSLRIYPHHILRENPLASGAGADRMSTGMKKSFGKAIGRAAQVKTGQALMTIKINKTNLPIAREAFRRAKHKLPCTTTIEVKPLK